MLIVFVLAVGMLVVTMFVLGIVGTPSVSE
jgi:hypothetical protein